MGDEADIMISIMRRIDALEAWREDIDPEPEVCGHPIHELGASLEDPFSYVKEWHFCPVCGVGL